MAGKDEIKLKKDEIRFRDKRIDAKRFAYDIVKYTTAKFGLPEDCNLVWTGSNNVYGCDDFCSVISKQIIPYQIVLRHRFYTYFDKRHKSHGLASFDAIVRLFQNFKYDEIPETEYDILGKVEISLSILGELVLYLYTKDIDFHLKQLIDHWFDCHFYINKKSFEDAGGLAKLYDRNEEEKFDRYDYFHELFIKNYCLPYKDTAGNPDLEAIYCRSYGTRIQKHVESKLPSCSKSFVKELFGAGLEIMRQPERKGCKSALQIVIGPSGGETVRIVSEDDTVIKLPKKALLGMPGHHEVPSGAVGPPSQDVPESERKGFKLSFDIKEEAVPEPPKQVETAKMNPDDNSGVKLPASTGSGIPEHHKMYGDCGLLGAAGPPSQDVPEADSEKLKDGRRPSTKEKMDMRKAGFRPSLDQDLGMLEPHELYAFGGPWDAAVPTFQDLPQSNPLFLRKPSVGDKMQTGISGVPPSLEESLGRLNLDSQEPRVSMNGKK